MNRLSVGVIAVLAQITAAPAFAQSLTSAERDAALRQIEATIQAHYVFADKRQLVVAALERARQSGRYAVESPALFAKLVSDDLRAASGDGHLYLRDNPVEFAAATKPPRADDGLEALRRAEAKRWHSGLAQLQILPGNVRYLRITQFRWNPDETPRDYAEAARFLMGGDAVIVDLRDNGGGSSDAADLFMRTLLPPDPLRPNGAGAAGRDPRWAEKPRYILISAGTGSAAEAVSYGAQQERVAIIVGTASYGAANNTRYFPVAPRFVLSVSYHRPINPISGTNWEGVGVQPDMAVSAERALAAAHGDALKKLAARPGLTNVERAALEWAMVDARAGAEPPRLSANQRKRYSGHYGTIELREEGDGLYFYRSDRPKRPQGIALRPLTGDGLFAVDGYVDLRIRVTGEGVELLHGSVDAIERFPRTTPD